MTLWVTDSLDVNLVGYNVYYNWDCELLTSNNGHFYWPYQHYVYNYVACGENKQYTYVFIITI